MSLKLRLVLWIALMLSVSLTLGTALAWWHATRSVETEMQAALVVGQQTAKAILPHVVRDGDAASTLRQLVHAFDGNRHLRATLITSDGVAIERSLLQPPPEHVPSWFARAVMAKAPPAARTTLPAALGGGALLLETDPRNEMTEVWTDFRDDVEILVLFAAITFLAVFWMLARMLAPLERLAAAFRRVGGAAAPRHVAVEGPPELRRLAGGFNAMVDRLAVFESTNRRLAEQLSTIQEDERAEIARDLHDEISPQLFAMGVDAAALRKHAEDRGDRGAVELAQSIGEGITHVQHEVKAMLGRLRSGSLSEFGLPQAIRNLTLFWQNRRPDVRIAVRMPDAAFDERTEGAVYRIVQEGLSNAMRHGRPSRIDIAIAATDSHELAIEVTDDGGGFKEVGGGSGFGLRGMAERVTALGGNLEVRARTEPAGVSIVVRLPVAPDDSAIGAGGDEMAA